MKVRLFGLVPKWLQPAMRRAWHRITLRGSEAMVERRMRWKARRGDGLSGLLHRKMLVDRRPMLTTIADKLSARGYIAEFAGLDYLPRLLDSNTTVDTIDWEALPPTYVVKVNHGSGGVVVVTDDADPDARLPLPSPRLGWINLRVRPEHADVTVISELCSYWLRLDYSWVPGSGSVEWCYKGIQRMVMVEELLKDDIGRPPREYRLFVIGGRVRFLQVELQDAGIDYTAVMSPEWNLLPARFLNPAPVRAPERPRLLGEMLEIATKLAQPVGDFLRVDLYDLGSRIVVGELTNYPYGGILPVRPRSFDKEWAEHWPC